MILPKLRRGFNDAYPAVQFGQVEGDQAELFDGLRMARRDVALTYDLNIPPDLAFQPLLPLAPYALFPEGQALTDRATVSPQDLAPYPMVLLDLPHSADYFLSFFSDAGVTPHIAERTRDLGVMRAMVANGFGYSIANIWLGSDRVPDGKKLVFVPLVAGLRPMQIGLLLPKGAVPRRAVAAFVAECQRPVTARALTGLYRG